MPPTRSQSATSMQQVYTPRVKDGRRSNESPQGHYYGKTAPKFSHLNANSNHHFKYLH